MSLYRWCTVMPHDLIWERDGVYWKYHGNVSGQEIVETSTSIYSDQRFDTLKYKLVDFLDVESVKIDDDELALVAYQHRSVEKFNPYVKTAIVLHPSGMKLANKFAAFFSESFWDVRVFENMEEANSWLGRVPSS